jgi:thioredoxin 1
MAIEVTDQNFEDLILKADKPAIVDFWAEWCGPCRVIGPVVEKIGEEYADQIIVAKLDVESSSQVPAKYGIRNIPTLLFFKDGELKDKQVGNVPKEKIIDKLKPLL